MHDLFLPRDGARLKPEGTKHAPVGPQVVGYAADQRKRSCPGSCCALSNDLLDEAAILECLPIIEWRSLVDLGRCEPDKDLRAKKSAREVKVNLIWETVRKYFMKVLRYLGCGYMMRVVVVWCRVGGAGRASARGRTLPSEERTRGI